MFNLTPWKQQQNGLTSSENPFNRIREEFDSLFNRFFGDFPLANGTWNPSAFWGLDVQDRDQAVAVRVEAPGFEAEDFNVQVSGNLLTIRAERKDESGEAQQQSFSRRRLERSVTLPAAVEANQVEARYRNGILEVILPKTPTAQGRRIEVRKS